MTADQRAAISRKVAELRNCVEADDGAENRKARLALVANMLMAYPMSGAGEETGKARANAYLGALDDLPPWSIAEAVRKWHRGESGCKDANYRFAPAPAELRYAAQHILQPAKQALVHLELLLSATTLDRAMDPEPIENLPTRPTLKVMP